MSTPHVSSHVPRILGSLLCVFLLTGPLEAGEMPAPSDPVKNPVCAVPFYGSVSFGYESSYLFRGGRYGDHAPWAGLDLNLDLNQNLSLNFGTWYINPTKQNAIVNDEFDLYAYLFFPFDCPVTGSWDVGVGGSWFFFLEDEFDEGEVNLLLTKSIGNLFDFTFDYVYDVTFEGHYFGYYADKSIPLTQCLDLDLGTGISHGDDNYNFLVLGGDHVYAKAGLTFHLTQTADFSTYILGNFPFNDLEEAGQESDVYGGASVTISF